MFGWEGLDTRTPVNRGATRGANVHAANVVALARHNQRAATPQISD